MSQIKIERARRLSSTGNYPATFDAMLAHVSAAIITSVTGRPLNPKSRSPFGSRFTQPPRTSFRYERSH